MAAEAPTGANAHTTSETFQENAADGTINHNARLPSSSSHNDEENERRSSISAKAAAETEDRLYHDMDIVQTLQTGNHCSSSLLSEESALNCDLSFSFPNNQNRQVQSESPSLQAVASGAQHSESNAASFHWPIFSRLDATAEDRAKYFNGLQKVVLESEHKAPVEQQATTLLDLMLIRAYHSEALRRFSLATAIGFRTRKGVLTKIPAIIVFVARKVHKEWLQEAQRLPYTLPGPGGIWCDVDVVEFSYYGTPADTPKKEIYSELVERLQGNDPTIGPGSQVASQETYGTLGAIVQSRTGAHQVGFLTNRHVAVDLDYPNQKMFHPLPPNLGPGVYLGAVERATSFITDDLWYSIFASKNPETFVRADGAFIPFGDSFDISRVTTTVKGVGDMGDVMKIELLAPIESIVGRQVVKVGRSSGLTKGRIMAYALEYNDEKGICFFTDFLIVGENNQAFDLEGDSGSLILMVIEEGKKYRPVGIIWGGTANRGRLKLKTGHEPENWTSGVDLGRLLGLLQLDLVTSNEKLQAAVDKQRRSVSGPTTGETCHRSFQSLDNDVTGDDAFRETAIVDPLRLHLRLPPQQNRENMSAGGLGLQDIATSAEPLVIPNLEPCLLDFGFAPVERDEVHNSGHDTFKENGGELSLDLHINEREIKRRKS